MTDTGLPSPSLVGQWLRAATTDPADLPDRLESVLGVLARISYLADAIGDCLSIWLGPEVWSRMTGEDAASVIDGLSDVQLVIDSILSEQWENRSILSQRFRVYEDGLPREFIPDHPDINQQAELEGLTRWRGDPSGLWVLPPPPPTPP